MPTAAHDGGPALHLLPAWLGVAWAAVFVVISVSHLRHMVQTTGQRRPWHACHVLMALGMAFMFLPSNVDPLAIPAGFWKLTFATAGLIAAVWALGGVGRTATIIWLLTSIDLGAMLYMWSGAGRPGDAAVTWMLSGYLVGEALAWGLDLYRRIDGGAPLVSWQQLALDSGGGPATGSRGRGGGVRVGSTVVAAAEDARSLLGTLDISASMVMMTIGMAYMLVATALGT
jgi:hypothetical protein